MADTNITIPELGSLTAGQVSDLLLVTRGTTGYKMLVSDIAKTIIETYQGSSLAGSTQSVKAALDSLNSSLATLNGSITPNPDVLVNSFDPTYSYIKKTGNVAILSLLTNGANITTVWQRLCTVSFKPQRNTMFIFYTLNTTISVGEGYIDTDGNVFVRALAEGTFNIRMSCAFAVQ